MVGSELYQIAEVLADFRLGNNVVLEALEAQVDVVEKLQV